MGRYHVDAQHVACHLRGMICHVITQGHVMATVAKDFLPGNGCQAFLVVKINFFSIFNPKYVDFTAKNSGRRAFFFEKKRGRRLYFIFDKFFSKPGLGTR